MRDICVDQIDVVEFLYKGELLEYRIVDRSGGLYWDEPLRFVPQNGSVLEAHVGQAVWLLCATIRPLDGDG